MLLVGDLFRNIGYEMECIMWYWKGIMLNYNIAKNSDIKCLFLKDILIIISNVFKVSSHAVILCYLYNYLKLLRKDFIT